MVAPVVACRICESRTLEPVLSLGDMPAVNSFLAGPEAIATEGRYPLAIAFCASCTHVQLTHMLDPKDIFEDYIYFSSMSETVVAHGRDLAARYVGEQNLVRTDLVAELASNDGCILKPFQGHCRVLGVEPAKNIAAVANGEGIPTRAEFFNSSRGRALRAEVGPARLILARNVVAHVPEVVDFVTGAASWLADDGIFHVEVPYLRHFVERNEFDTIYHEHLSYFSVTAIAQLFERAGLVLWDVEEIPLHGGSLVARGKRAGTQARDSVRRYLELERQQSFAKMEGLLQFARRTESLRDEIPSFLHSLKRQGKRLAAYGAAAKGVVLSNYCGLTSDLLEFVADRSPYKQGRLMPGVHLPVVAPEVVEQSQPDYLVVLAWNMVEEIVRQRHAYASAGGQFVVPIPRPTLLGSTP